MKIWILGYGFQDYQYTLSMLQQEYDDIEEMFLEGTLAEEISWPLLKDLDRKLEQAYKDLCN